MVLIAGVESALTAYLAVGRYETLLFPQRCNLRFSCVSVGERHARAAPFGVCLKVAFRGLGVSRALSPYCA